MFLFIPCSSKCSFSWSFKYVRCEVLTAVKMSMVVVLDCGAKWTCRGGPTFWRNILPPSSGLKMDAVCSFKTLVLTYKSIWCHNPEDHHEHFDVCALFLPVHPVRPTKEGQNGSLLTSNSFVWVALETHSHCSLNHISGNVMLFLTFYVILSFEIL
jgi:hypothetical protein